MREFSVFLILFFHEGGWRRQCGFVILICAASFMFSPASFHDDIVSVRTLKLVALNPDGMSIRSNESIIWARVQFDDEPEPQNQEQLMARGERLHARHQTIRETESPQNRLAFDFYDSGWHWRWCGFGFGTFSSELLGGGRLVITRIPSWSFWLFISSWVLLSAYLLIRKPSEKKSGQTHV